MKSSLLQLSKATPLVKSSLKYNPNRRFFQRLLGPFTYVASIIAISKKCGNYEPN